MAWDPAAYNMPPGTTEEQYNNLVPYQGPVVNYGLGAHPQSGSGRYQTTPTPVYPNYTQDPVYNANAGRTGAGAAAAAGVSGYSAGRGGTIGPADFTALLSNDPFYSNQVGLLSAQGLADAAQRSQSVAQALIQFGAVPDFQSFYGSGTMPATGAPPPQPTYGGPQAPNAKNFARGMRDPNYRAALTSYQRAWDSYQRQLDQWKKLYGAATMGPYAQDVSGPVADLARQNTAAGLSVIARLDKQHADQRRAIEADLAARGILSSGETGYQLGQEALRYNQSTYDATQELLQYLQGIYAAYSQSNLQREFGMESALEDAYGRASTT